MTGESLYTVDLEVGGEPFVWMGDATSANDAVERAKAWAAPTITNVCRGDDVQASPIHLH